jgi:hypothetical protein
MRIETQADREEARRVLAAFLGGPREKYSFMAMGLVIGKLLVFYAPKEFEQIESMTEPNDLDLQQATDIRVARYKMDPATAREQVERWAAKSHQAQLEKLRYLPDIVMTTVQKAVNDVELNIRASILRPLGIDVSRVNPWGDFPTETSVKKGVVETRVKVPRHRPKGSSSFDKEAFLAAVNASIRRLARRNRRIPLQAEVARNLENFSSREDVFAKRYSRCNTGKRWEAYARGVLRKAGITLKPKMDKKSGT